MKTDWAKYATIAALLGSTSIARAQDASSADVDKLMKVIEQQQAQLDSLRAEVETLKKEQKKTAAIVATPAPRPVAKPTAAVAAPTASAPVTATAAAAAEAPPAEDAARETQMVEDGFVWRTSSGMTLRFSGQVNPALNSVSDGLSNKTLFVDNDTSGSRLRFDVDAPAGETTFSGVLEVGISPNNSYDISQINQSDSGDVTVRRAEVVVRDDRFGRIMLGQGSVAADDVAEYDLSLTAGPIMYSGVADIAGGVIFTNGSDYINFGTADNPDYLTVGGAFYNFDPGRIERIRYDTPMWGPVQASVSYGADDQWAAAVTLGGDYGDWSGWTVGDFTTLAAIGAYNTDDPNLNVTYAGSVSVLYDPLGLSLTLSGGHSDLKEGQDPSNFYAKLGYDTQIWSIGKTGFGIDYTSGNNIYGNGYDGTSWGIAMVQQIDPYGIDIYAQYRDYSLTSPDVPNLHDINVFTVGTKFTF